MPHTLVFSIFYVAIFLQGGAYGLTFLLPDLFANLQGDEKQVGIALFLSAISTITTILTLNRLSRLLSDLSIMAIACFAIAVSLLLFVQGSLVGVWQYLAALILGFGWGITYSLAPIILTKVTTEAQRVRYFALLSVAMMAGFGGSPILHAWMMDAGYAIQDSFQIVALLAILSALCFMFLQQTSEVFPKNNEMKQVKKLDINCLKQIYHSDAYATIIMVLLGACVFAGMSNFQTVFAAERNVDYSHFFLIYTLTVVVFRAVLAGKSIGNKPYLSIALLQIFMLLAALLMLILDGNMWLYSIIAFFFALGYGVSYPILAAQASKDAQSSIMSETMQLFAISYFVGIFGFPLIAGWIIVELNSNILLLLIACLALFEIMIALRKNKAID